jgi:hypothetical protein
MKKRADRAKNRSQKQQVNYLERARGEMDIRNDGIGLMPQRSFLLPVNSIKSYEIHHNHHIISVQTADSLKKKNYSSSMQIDVFVQARDRCKPNTHETYDLTEYSEIPTSQVKSEVPECIGLAGSTLVTRLFLLVIEGVCVAI